MEFENSQLLVETMQSLQQRWISQSRDQNAKLNLLKAEMEACGRRIAQAESRIDREGSTRYLRQQVNIPLFVSRKSPEHPPPQNSTLAAGQAGDVDPLLRSLRSLSQFQDLHAGQDFSVFPTLPPALSNRRLVESFDPAGRRIAPLAAPREFEHMPSQVLPDPVANVVVMEAPFAVDIEPDNWSINARRRPTGGVEIFPELVGDQLRERSLSTADSAVPPVPIVPIPDLKPKPVNDPPPAMPFVEKQAPREDFKRLETAHVRTDFPSRSRPRPARHRPKRAISAAADSIENIPKAVEQKAKVPEVGRPAPSSNDQKRRAGLFADLVDESPLAPTGKSMPLDKPATIAEPKSMTKPKDSSKKSREEILKSLFDDDDDDD